jgi:hypothetical protein
MTTPICISHITETLNKLRPLFKSFPLDRIEIDLFPEGKPEFYFAFKLSTTDEECSEYLDKIYQSKLTLDLTDNDSEQLPETLHKRCEELMQLYYPLPLPWNVCVITLAPMTAILNEIEDESSQRKLPAMPYEIGFHMETEILIEESSNEVELETCYGNADLLLEEFMLKTGTLH